jgi:HEAT repeat protein
MSRRMRTPLLIVGSIVLIFVAWELLEQAFQPHYAGRTVKQWFREYCRSHEADEPDWYQVERSQLAFQRMGTNAVPFLLEQALVTNGDDALTVNFYRLLKFLPKSWHLPQYIPAERVQERAMEALSNLQAPPALIVPVLRRSLNGANDVQHIRALRIIASLGKGVDPALPYLMRDLKSTNETIRLLALAGTQNLAVSNYAVVVPILTEMQSSEFTRMESSEERIQGAWMLKAIRAFGTNAVQALPELRKEFQTTTNALLLYQLATTIGRVAPDDRMAMNFLLQGLHQKRDLDHRYYALNGLGEIGTNASYVAEALVEALDDPDFRMFGDTLYWIEQNGISKEAYFPRLEMQLSSTDDSRRLDVAGAILVQKPDHQAALRVLTEVVKTPSGLQAGAISLLCDRRPDAKETVELLNQVSKDARPDVQQVIRDALKRMEIKKRLEREMP